MDCTTCREYRRTIEQKNEPVAYIVHESAMARQERTIKRLWIALLLAISFLVATNGAWIWYESQFETVVISAEQESNSGGINYIVNGENYGGSAESDD